jgi:hypothetical protein
MSVQTKENTIDLEDNHSELTEGDSTPITEAVYKDNGKYAKFFDQGGTSNNNNNNV